MNVHHGPRLGLALLIALAGCARARAGLDTTVPSPVASSRSASATEGEHPAAPTGAFFLDLRTGEQAPLPSTSVEDSDSGARFNGGYYYAVSTDGSRGSTEKSIEVIE